MSKIWAAAAVSLSIFLGACSSLNYNSDEVPDISPDNLYKVAKASMNTGDYTFAQRYLEAIDSRYPFGELSEQVQLDLIYVYYKERESELASAQIKRFIRLNPTHPNIDYVYYMKGLTEMQMRSDMIQDYLGLDRSEKDPSMYLEAFKSFKELISSYPNSIYAADARQRMIFIKNELAKRQMAIAKYYYEREAYLSSIRACQTILRTYRNTEEFKPAMELMAQGYEKLHLKAPAANVRAVMNNSFGSNYQAAIVDNGLPKDQAAAEGPTAPEDEGSWYDFLLFWK